MSYEFVFLFFCGFILGAAWKTFVDHALISFVFLRKKEERGKKFNWLPVFPCVCHGGPFDGKLFTGFKDGEVLFFLHDKTKSAVKYGALKKRDEKGKIVYQHMDDLKEEKFPRDLPVYP